MNKFKTSLTCVSNIVKLQKGRHFEIMEVKNVKLFFTR